jgi:lipopolysaccharide transport system ATP-binding protein
LRKKYHHDFYALKNVDFSIKKGETFGIVGRNGSGKSTLLKLITGVLTPTSGMVTVKGTISALLELGAGFNPELTGVENIYFNGTLMGYSREEMDAKYDDILSFADIGEFAFQPVKLYSSGMFVRLAFAVGISINPDILIIDEALSVGDAWFQKKCMNKMEAIKDNGATIVFVSHDTNSIKTLCRQALLLDRGEVLATGSPPQVLDHYESILLQESHAGERSISVETDGYNDKRITIATGEVELIAIDVKDEQGRSVNEIMSDSDASIEFTLSSLSRLSDPHYGISIRNKYGISIFETNTHCMGISTAPLDRGQSVTVRFIMPFNIAPGDYFISVGAANKAFGMDDFREYLLWVYDVRKLTITKPFSSMRFGGIFNMKPQVTIDPGERQ